jgi:hypothetical protein
VANSTSQAKRGFISRIAFAFTTRAWVLILTGLGIGAPCRRSKRSL